MVFKTSLLFSPWSLVLALSITRKVQADEEACGLWLGPSPVKEAEKHGFGFGIFTGRQIKKGEILKAEHFIPLYDYEDEHHPPLREILWYTGSKMPRIVLESEVSMISFIAGLASIAPCTSTNYNLEETHKIHRDDNGNHRSRSATTGSVTYFDNAMFTATRDISPGEELIVDCSDDDYDGAVYKDKLNHFDSTKYCLDNNLEEGRSTVPGVGKGLFAKRALKKGEILLSTPMTPLHRNETAMRNERQQLITNYCYGDPESELLWLPHGPLINAINHSPSKAGAKVQWHQDSDNTNNDLSKRQQYHHPELLGAAAEVVANVHGMGLVMDLVATRDIAQGEEVFLDYGEAWSKAWDEHQSRWREASMEPGYVSAEAYNEAHENEELLTMMEQRRNPYPHNLETACYFETDWIVDGQEYDDFVTYKSWNDQQNPWNCLLPCLIMDKYEPEENGDGSGKVYMAKLVDTQPDNVSLGWDCHIFPKFEYLYQDIPREGITFIDRPYSSDVWLKEAFRHPIGVPKDMYPDVWKKRNFRRRSTELSADTEEFKRKTVVNRKETLENLRLTKTEAFRTDL